MIPKNGNHGAILITGGKIVDPVSGTDAPGDLLVVDKNVEGMTTPGTGKDLAKARGLDPDSIIVLNAENMIVSPGLVDMHVHFREPGFEQKETIATGSAAAVAGGFTSVACMPNTNPPVDNRETVIFVLERAAAAGLARVFPIGCVSESRAGSELAEMWLMKDAGAVAFSDDGDVVGNTGLMRHALEYSGQLGLPIIEHPQDPDLSGKGVMHEGAVSTTLGMRGIPAAAEEVIIARDLILLEHFGGRLHFAHVSTRGAVELIRRAKEKGLPVTAEVTPHHITFSHESLENYDTDFKMNPPLRTEEDRDALIEGLCDGTIDCIATDHAPHRHDEKEVEFDYAPFGVIGLETALGACLETLFHSGRMSMIELIQKMSVNPAKILGISGGSIRPGAPADITIFSPNEPSLVVPDDFRSKASNTPFKGMTLRGRNKYTIVGGRLVFSSLED